MFNRTRQENLFAEMKYIFRNYNRAVKTHKDAVDRAMIHAMKDQTVPDYIKSTIENAQRDMEYYPKRLQELKIAYIKMIEAINLPSIG